MTKKKRSFWPCLSVITIGVLLLVVIVASLSLFIVRESQCAIVTQFGKTVRIIQTPGLYYKWPGFLQDVTRFDKRIHTFKTRPIQLLLGDKNPLILTCYVCWQIDDPLLFFQSVVTPEMAIQRMDDMISSQMGSVLGDYTISNIINTNAVDIKLTEIESRITDNADTKAELKYGISILSVGITRINYPEIVAQAVYKRMKAEREKEAERYRAEGYEQSTIIRAEAETEVDRIMAEAYRQSEILKGEGDQDAMTTYAKAFSVDPDYFTFVKSLELYEAVLKNRTTLILSTESELFKYLNHPDAAGSNK